MKEYHRSEAIEDQELMASTSDAASVGVSINRMGVLVGIIVMGAMFADKQSVTVAVLAGATFYLIVAGLLILFQPTALPWIIVNAQNQRTIRLRDKNQHREQMTFVNSSVTIVPPLQLERRPPALPLALPEGPRYVSAVPRAEDDLKTAAVGFVTQLFNVNTGKPRPNRITPHKKQIQFKSPEPPVIAYLESLGIIYQDNSKHLYWDAATFPTLRLALIAIKSGIRPSTTEQGWVDGMGRVSESEAA